MHPDSPRENLSHSMHAKCQANVAHTPKIDHGHCSSMKSARYQSWTKAQRRSASWARQMPQANVSFLSTTPKRVSCRVRAQELDAVDRPFAHYDQLWDSMHSGGVTNPAGVPVSLFPPARANLVALIQNYMHIVPGWQLLGISSLFSSLLMRQAWPDKREARLSVVWQWNHNVNQQAATSWPWQRGASK